MFLFQQGRFTSVHSKQAIEREIEMADALIEHDSSAFPDCSFEEGYAAALRFVLNRQASNVSEEYEAMLLDKCNELRPLEVAHESL
ncbi:hypothetical protein [Vibrio mediterranei]|uniref:hypothetical protein n=1 Tax=Vibrio mediterranei TaxID=689 RepID=UPI002283EC31|nr:hypothetical protein [Vibrio mediterranei]MCY9855425.1 hypothetical protein [Vibrio mediterranei]